MSSPTPAGMPDPDAHTGAASADDKDGVDGDEDAPSTESASDADGGDD